MRVEALRPWLIDALREAKLAADHAEGENPDDGGSANFDTTILILPRVHESTMRSVSEASGVRVERKTGSSGQWWVWLNGGAQGALRTRRVEAAAEALRLQGFDAHVWYALD